MLSPTDEQQQVCAVCMWTNDDGHDADDWLNFTPWNRHLLCSDCMAQIRTFEEHARAAASRYGGVMNPEDIDAFDAGEEAEEDAGDVVYAAFDNNGEIAELFLDAGDDSEMENPNNISDNEEEEEEEGAAESDNNSVSTLSILLSRPSNLS